MIGDDVFDKSGRHVGRRQGDKIFGPNGRYGGTIVSDTVVYHSVERAQLGSSFAPRAGISASAQINRVGSAIAGEEPFE